MEVYVPGLSPWLTDGRPLLPLKVVVPLCTHTPSVCFYVQIFPSYKAISQIGFGPTLMDSF